MSLANRIVPAAVVGVCALYVVVAMFMPDTGNSKGIDLDTARRLPAVDGGRVKPLDTVARTSLRIISGRESYYDRNDDKQPAIRWLLEVMSFDPDDKDSPVWEYEVFRIDNDQV